MKIRTSDNIASDGASTIAAIVNRLNTVGVLSSRNQAHNVNTSRGGGLFSGRFTFHAGKHRQLEKRRKATMVNKTLKKYNAKKTPKLPLIVYSWGQHIELWKHTEIFANSYLLHNVTLQPDRTKLNLIYTQILLHCPYKLAANSVRLPQYWMGAEHELWLKARLVNAGRPIQNRWVMGS